MKNSIAVITAVFVLTISGLVLAQMDDKGKDMTADKAGMMEGKGGMMGMMNDKGGMMSKGMMMSGMMNKASMVASNDGGVIILSGHKLSKYDAKLNLVKEVEIKAEEGKMCAMCQKMGKGMGKPDMDNDDDDKAPAAGADEHAGHHPKQ